jgi:mono/diheme cytochrome c family protein
MRSLCALAAAAALIATPASAQDAASLLKEYEAAAKAAASFSGFSPARGQQFFQATHGGDLSCASCHTTDPRARGEHARTGKSISPLAPSANAARFSRLDKSEKWFRRNCNDVLSRECTAQEKGDVLAYLMSLGR